MKRLIAGLAAAAALVTTVSSSSPVLEDGPSLAVEEAILAQAKPLAPGASCPSDMVEVEGDYYPAVEHLCAKWIDGQQNRDRCAEYRPTSRPLGKPTHKRFCIDRFEWPNKKGAVPVVAVSWDEARAECGSVGKRLCKDTEWTLACEGAERLPYPYGYTRDASACNHDKFYIQPNNDAYADPKTRAAEIARVDQREPSGARDACTSPYGVHDMTGNVDEWVTNETGSVTKEPYVSGLKGGYWGPVRNRCRPMTVDHNQWHNGYQIGFRCCGDVGSIASKPEAKGAAKAKTGI